MRFYSYIHVSFFLIFKAEIINSASSFDADTNIPSSSPSPSSYPWENVPKRDLRDPDSGIVVDKAPIWSDMNRKFKMEPGEGTTMGEQSRSFWKKLDTKYGQEQYLPGTFPSSGGGKPASGHVKPSLSAMPHHYLSSSSLIESESLEDSERLSKICSNWCQNVWIHEKLSPSTPSFMPPSPAIDSSTIAPPIQKVKLPSSKKTITVSRPFKKPSKEKTKDSEGSRSTTIKYEPLFESKEWSIRILNAINRHSMMGMRNE